MHPKSAPSSFLGASIIPHELTMETAASPANHIVGANGIPKREELTLMTSSAALEAVLRTK